MKRKRHPKQYRPMEKKAVLVIVLALLLTMGVTFYANEPAGIDTVTVTVRPGDTLWDLAQDYHRAGTDIRSYVARIAEMNHLSNQSLTPGDRLTIPLLP